MKTIPFALVVAFFLVSLPPAQAEVQPFSVRLEVGGIDSYTVPAGKVLVMEWLFRDSFAGTPDVLWNKAGGAVRLGSTDLLSGSSSDVGAFVRPIRAVEGESVSVDGNLGNVSWLSGLLIDTADLYATVPSEFKQTGVSAAQFAATLKQSSPRPTVVKVETSTDLKTWVPDATAAVKSTADKMAKEVTVAANAPAKYVRAKVISRVKE